MSDNLIFLESPGQMKKALAAAARTNETDSKLIALTPHVEYALKKAGHPYGRPEDYHTEDDINRVGFENLIQLDRFCETTDRLIQDDWELLRTHNIQPARMNYYSLKILLNSVSVRAFILRKILEAENPRRVLYFGTGKEKVDSYLFFVHDSAWCLVIPEVCQAFGVTIETLKGTFDPTVLDRRYLPFLKELQYEAKKMAKRVLRQSIRHKLKDWITNWKRQGKPSRVHPQASGAMSKPAILALERNYSLGQLLSEVAKRDEFNILHWDQIRSSASTFQTSSLSEVESTAKSKPSNIEIQNPRGSMLWASVKDSADFRNELVFEGTDCFPVLESRLQRFFENNVPECANIYMKARSLISDFHPFVVLAATMGNFEHHAVALAASDEHVPFVVYRHGATGGHAKMKASPNYTVETIEVQSADYIMVFGPGDAAYLQADQENSAELISIGSADLDGLKKSPGSRESALAKLGLKRNKKTVIYVPTTMDGNHRATPHRGRSPSRAFDLEQSIVSIFEEFPDVQFIVKLMTSPLHPCSPIARLVKDRNIRNCTVAYEPFTELLPAADMFISDYPSTSFLEMLTTDRPILLCGFELPWPWSPEKWHQSVVDMWKERVAYSDRLDEFVGMLRTYLREERFQAVESNNTMLKQFGTHLDDGRSVDRAHAFIKSLVTRDSPKPHVTDVRIEDGI